MSAHDRPLAISLLLGASGWVAGVFMLVFVAMLFHPDSAGQAAVSGCVLLAAAWGLFKVDRDGELVFVAPVASAALLLQAVLALAMPNRLHRVLSTLFATIAWALTLRFALFGESDDWHGGSAAQAAPLPSALAGWVFAWVPVAAGLWWTIRNERAWMGGRWEPTRLARHQRVLLRGGHGRAIQQGALRRVPRRSCLGRGGAGRPAQRPARGAVNAQAASCARIASMTVL